MNKTEIYALLKANDIKYEITEHQAVFNMKDVAEINMPYPEADAKNLFVRDDKKRQYYLITVKGDKKVHLKEFKQKYGTRSLSFASPEDLYSKLKLTPGSVTPFGLLNDESKSVCFYLDRELEQGLIGCHPNDNTATVWLSAADLLRLIEEHGNPIIIADL